tara:strand:- start:273 stop:437 length:165 start_codon:yes stop_codon:yes gene_type:complete
MEIESEGYYTYNDKKYPKAQMKDFIRFAKGHRIDKCIYDKCECRTCKDVCCNLK